MPWSHSPTDIDSLTPQLIEIRRDIHRHPELGFEEVRTQKLVRQWLEKLGYQAHDCAQTGLYADLHPDRVESGPTIALRADLDCLPMQEHTDLPYRSVHDGRAHKCGHDGHTAILLGVAAVLARHRNDVPGNVRLLFQPAEEGVRGGGAKVMVAEGALEGVREVYGLHNWPGYPFGSVRVVAGPAMAHVHNFEIAVEGRGGHGSQPQSCRDPIVCACALVTAMQTIVSRGLSSNGGAVLSVCTFHAGEANNVIPALARLSGTIRSFSVQARDRVLERLHEVAHGTAAAHGCTVELNIEDVYPVLENDAGCVAAVERVAKAHPDVVEVSDAGLPMAGGEDFSFFARERPSAYFFLGARREEEFTPGCHHPDFDFDDRLISLGMQMFLGLVGDRLDSPQGL